MLKTIKRYIPEPIKKLKRQALIAIKKPELRYVEFHLTDHCNLNCKGCGHFSPISSPWYANIDQHEKDMKRLSQLFYNIHTIRLMGGETLLHPEAASFISITRKLHPKTDIRFVTNGLLLKNASDDFWITCRDTNTIIDLTVYPPLQPFVEELRSLCKSKGVTLNPREVELFHAHMNLKGDSDEHKNIAICRRQMYCPFLQNGHLYHCAMPPLIHYFNEQFQHHIPADEGIDIYSQSITGRKIIRLLEKPISNCKYCEFDVVAFSWAKSSHRLEEWDVETQRKLVGKNC
ncbi:MAG: radical SAM protein [Bacteroidales bacterium]